MNYTAFYDLSALPSLNWRSLVLPFFLALAAAVCAYYAKAGMQRNGLLGFAGVCIVFFAIIPFWDYWRLRNRLVKGECLVAEGELTNYWEKDWWKRVDGKTRSYSHEGFRVNDVPFAYDRLEEGNQFTNANTPRIAFRNGQHVRIYYVSDPIIGEDTRLNRIVKLELVQSESAFTTPVNR